MIPLLVQSISLDTNFKLLSKFMFCIGAPELGEKLFSPPLYRQRYQAVLTYLEEEQQNVGPIQVSPLHLSSFVQIFVFLS